MMPQICKWNKRCTVPWPLGIVSLQLPQLMWQAQLRGFAAIPQWPGAGTAILYLLLAGNDKPIMINQLNLRLRHLNLYNYTHKWFAFNFKSASPRVVAAVFSAAVRFALCWKYKYRSWRWSRKIAMYLTPLEASLQASASRWAAQATPTTLGKLSVSCFTTPFKRPVVNKICFTNEFFKKHQGK